MDKIKKIFTGLYALSIFIGVFLAYFVRSSDGTDGLGRQLYDSPGLMKFFWGEEYWAGFGWFVFDMIYFWGGILFFVYVVWRKK
tara:strand:- start:100 stop:351 length:252 start_codon:yes stop_codon:yes gene_type:complete